MTSNLMVNYLASQENQLHLERAVARDWMAKQAARYGGEIDASASSNPPRPLAAFVNRCRQVMRAATGVDRPRAAAPLLDRIT